MEPFRLPEDFLLGCATAALQIEGGDTNNNWYEWSELGKIKDGSKSTRANDHWNRVEEDCALMRELHIQVYRMGIEWSRIEPLPGQFNDEAIEHYRKEIKLLQESGIRPLVTLHHFTNPLWFEKAGAFAAKDCVSVFNRYVAYAVEHLGDLVSDWVTINEPNVYVTSGYVFGEWPPGEKSIAKAMKILRNLAKCHINAYRTIHEIREKNKFAGKTMVAFANHLQIFDPLHANSLLDRFGAKMLSYLFQDAITKTMSTGRFCLPIGFGSPLGKGRFYDYIGINYYSRRAVHGFQNTVMPGTERNDLNWEIYPEGLTILMKKMSEKYKAPIWITENGTCDAKDSFRPRYIYNHLKEIANSGLPVERYYYWTLMDNFEWVEGESAPFGLIALDFETQKRTVRKSGRLYAEIIQNHGVTKQMIERYLQE